MAKATIRFDPPPPPPPPPTRTIVLELTEQEAIALRSLLYQGVGGIEATTWRKYVTNISNALQDVPVVVLGTEPYCGDFISAKGELPKAYWP